VQRQPVPAVAPTTLTASPLVWQLALVVAVSAAYEALFVHYGIGWLYDEGWPLYAAMRLHAGGVLYSDTFFAFPPGHLLIAWIAYGIDPPGIILSRILYASFNVALCAAMLLLGRRFMQPPFALLGALLIALAAPRSHLSHLLFGYRYLVFSVLVLLAFAQRLRSTDRSEADRWMFVAGVAGGVSLYFRLTPAFAVSCGVGLGVWAHSRKWRIGLRDGCAYGAGMALVVVPILAWFQWSVGLDVMWREVVTRIVALQSAQSLPSPPFNVLPESSGRVDVYSWFIALQYRGYIVMYACYAAGLVLLWLRSLRRREAFDHALLLAIVVWGGLYLLRALGRSDDHHLNSALPPACLIIAHALGWLAQRVPTLARSSGLRARAFVAGGIFVVLAGWIYAQRIDEFLARDERGTNSVAATGGEVSVTALRVARRIDAVVKTIRESTPPEGVVLDLSAGPLFQVLMQRMGPGYIDVISPGIFLSAREEKLFVARLAVSPPHRVIWPRTAFDRKTKRTIHSYAPRVAAWVRANYEEEVVIQRYAILRPRDGSGSSKADVASGGDRADE
jgi:hypothetical protein